VQLNKPDTICWSGRVGGRGELADPYKISVTINSKQNKLGYWTLIKEN
jgi:hypothetical protein